MQGNSDAPHWSSKAVEVYQNEGCKKRVSGGVTMSLDDSIIILMSQELHTLITKLYPCAFLCAFDYVNCT